MSHISLLAIKHFIEVHAVIIYLLIFIGIILEGETVALLAGIFSPIGSMHVMLVFVAILLGGLTKATIGYTFGAKLREHHSQRKIVQKMERKICTFFPNFEKKPFVSIFISHFFILGINWLTLIFSGFKNIPFKKYIKTEILSFLVWETLVISIGFFFGYAAIALSRDFRNFIILILAFLVFFFILEKITAFIMELFAIRKIGEE